MNTQKPPAQAEEIVAAVRDLLSASADQVDGGLRFEQRVAARLMGLLERELALGGAADRAERQGLRALLDTQGKDGEAVETLALRARLCAAIARGERGLDDTTLVDHLWRSALAQIAIDSPDYRWQTAPASGS